MVLQITNDVIEAAGSALDNIDNTLVGMEECSRQITDLIIDFLTNGKGQCCLLEGDPNCGRESLLQKLVSSSYDLPLRVINVGYMAADQTIQETLAKEEDGEKWVFLIRDADELLTAHQQEFLYTISDKATRNSWLVFFSISRHNFLQNLEKRSSSRMARIRVTFEQATDFEEYCDAFRTLMTPPDPSYNDFIKNLRCEKWLRPLYEKYNYDVLKQCVALILQRIADYEDDDIEQIVKDAIEFATPGFHRTLELLQEYKKLVNTYYRLLNVSSDIFIFREIDNLISLGLLRADKTTNVAHMSFRKIWLGADALSAEKYCNNHLKLPTTVRDFFSTIPK